MSFLDTLAELFTRLKPSFSLGSRAASIGTRSIDHIRAIYATLTPLSTAKAGIKRLADRFPVLKSWQFWATTFTAASLVFAALALWTSFEASQYAKWTAHKDFTLLCIDQETRQFSSNCPDTANLSLPAPPGFHGTSARRDWIPFENTQDSSPAIRYSLTHIDPGRFYQEIRNIMDFTPGQCRANTTFWTTVQLVLALPAFLSGSLFPLWPRKSTKAARDALSESRQVSKNAALERFRLIWRARRRQIFVLFSLYLSSRLLCIDAVASQGMTLFSGSTEEDMSLMLSISRLLPIFLFPPLFHMFSCLKSYAPSLMGFAYNGGDLETIILEMMYLCWVPFLSFILTWPGYSLLRQTWWLQFILCIIPHPRDVDTMLEERYAGLVRESPNGAKILSDCTTRRGPIQQFLDAWKDHRERKSDLQLVGLVRCLRPEYNDRPGGEDDTERSETFVLRHGALSESSMLGRVGFGLESTGSVVFLAAIVYVWKC